MIICDNCLNYGNVGRYHIHLDAFGNRDENIVQLCPYCWGKLKDHIKAAIECYRFDPKMLKEKR